MGTPVLDDEHRLHGDDGTAAGQVPTSGGPTCATPGAATAAWLLPYIPPRLHRLGRFDRRTPPARYARTPSRRLHSERTCDHAERALGQTRPARRSRRGLPFGEGDFGNTGNPPLGELRAAVMHDRVPFGRDSGIPSSASQGATLRPIRRLVFHDIEPTDLRIVSNECCQM